MNVFQQGVVNGLGWVLVLADGWILHTHWLAVAGFILLVWSTWKMYKGLGMTTPEHGFNGTTAEDLVQAPDKFYTFTQAKMPVGELMINEDEKYYRFVPKPDMTGQEAGWIAMLFTTATINSRGVGITYCDYMGFVRAHGLERHFEEKQK